MVQEIQEISGFRITIEREKLARDPDSMRKVFETLEECGLSCECMALNLDWLSIVVRESEKGKLSRFMLVLGQRLSRIDISIDGEVAILYIEGSQITSRGIGIVDSSLVLQGIEITMQRYFRCQDRFVIGVSPKEADRARRIITRIMESNFQL